MLPQASVDEASGDTATPRPDAGRGRVPRAVMVVVYLAALGAFVGIDSESHSREGRHFLFASNRQGFRTHSGDGELRPQPHRQP